MVVVAIFNLSTWGQRQVVFEARLVYRVRSRTASLSENKLKDNKRRRRR